MREKGACHLPGVSICFDKFIPLMQRAVVRGFVPLAAAQFVYAGLRWGFRAGVDVTLLRGTRRYKNYPSAYEGRAGVTKGMRARVEAHKTVCLGRFDPDSFRDDLSRYSPCWRVFPLGAVAKPLEPDVMRPISDHTRSGLNEATNMEGLRYSLDTYSEIATFLHYGYKMRVADLDGAFPLLPWAPELWPFLLFVWEDVYEITPGECMYCNLNGDFGSAGFPGAFKIFFVDVVVGMARSEAVLTLPLVIHVDDLGHIGAEAEAVDEEGGRLREFLRPLGIFMKELKDKPAAERQLMVGFWWDSLHRTRTLEEQKLAAYMAQLLQFSARGSLTLRERQSIAGRMQRAVLTLPPGAACFLANIYALMRGLQLPWQKRRTTRGERADYVALRELLGLNMGKGYFSTDQFGRGDDVYTDASKAPRYAGGGYVSKCGRYRYWKYGTSAARQPIDFLEGDTVVLAVADLGPRWRGQKVRFHIDNQAFQKSAVKAWSRAERLTQLLRRLFALILQSGCILEFEWISTHDNVLADHLSRPGGEARFLHDVVSLKFLRPGVALSRHGLCGALRQLGGEYSSNVDKDGPQRGGGALDTALTVSYPRASIYTGLPHGIADRIDELLDGRLEASSRRTIMAALSHWDVARTRHGWARVIRSDDPERGGKLATWVLYMADDTTLVYASISDYVWGLRSWMRSQRQTDPVLGVMEWTEFMKSIRVVTWVPAEPRREVPLRMIKDSLQRVDRYSFMEVQTALLVLLLLFTFARSESPCPDTYEGDGSFDPLTHLQVRDVKVEAHGGRTVLCVRLKAIKQDRRLERATAAGNEDWVHVARAGVSEFDILEWLSKFWEFFGGVARDPEAPFFVANDMQRPLLYSAALRNARKMWGDTQAKRYGLHGLRVSGYNASKRGVGEALTVAHGGWSSDAHERYERFPWADVHRIPAVIAAAAENDALSGSDFSLPDPHAAAAVAPPPPPPPRPGPAPTPTAGQQLEGFPRGWKCARGGGRGTRKVYFSPQGERFTSVTAARAALLAAPAAGVPAPASAALEDVVADHDEPPTQLAAHLVAAGRQLPPAHPYAREGHRDPASSTASLARPRRDVRQQPAFVPGVPGSWSSAVSSRAYGSSGALYD